MFRLFSRLILEAPLLTPSAIEILKMYCQDEVMMFAQSSLVCLLFYYL